MKCGKNATADSDVAQGVALNSELMLLGMSVSGKCFKRNVFNKADEDSER